MGAAKRAVMDWMMRQFRGQKFPVVELNITQLWRDVRDRKTRYREDLDDGEPARWSKTAIVHAVKAWREANILELMEESEGRPNRYAIRWDFTLKRVPKTRESHGDSGGGNLPHTPSMKKASTSKKNPPGLQLAPSNWKNYAAGRFRQRLEKHGVGWAASLIGREIHQRGMKRQDVKGLWGHLSTLISSLKADDLDGSHPSHYGVLSEWIGEALYDARRSRSRGRQKQRKTRETPARGSDFYREKRRKVGLSEDVQDSHETASSKGEGKDGPTAPSTGPDEPNSTASVDLDEWRERMTEALEDFAE